MKIKQTKSGLEKMREKLYQRSFKQKTDSVRPVFYSKKSTISSRWEEDKKVKKQHKKKKPSITKAVFVVSLVFFVISFAVAVYVFFVGGNIVSSENVDIEIIGPVAVSGGENVSLQIIVTNNNNTPLQFTDLLIEYPDGVYDSENSSKQIKRFRKSLGVISPGESVSEIVRARVFGEESAQKEIKAILEYRIEGSNAIFVKENSYAFIIDSAPINIALNINNEVNVGQETKLLVSISSNGDKIMKDIYAKIDYPFGFEPISFNPKPSFGNNIWEIGDLAPGIGVDIEVTGIVYGNEDDDKIFRAYAGRVKEDDVSEIVTVYSSTMTKATIKQPFIGITFSIDGEVDEEYSVQSGSLLKGVLTWKNNLPVRVEDLVIEMSVSGEVLDSSSVFVDRGVYNSVEDKIIWDKRTFPKLGLIESGEIGRLNFRLASKKLLSSGLYLQNPKIILNVSTRGRAMPESSAPKAVEEFIERVIKINSDLQLSSRVVYSTGPFVNSGPLPPRVDTSTTYTVIWTVVNSSNDISNARVVATIPPYVSWLNNVSPSNENISFDEFTGEIVWDIGNIDSGAGVSIPAKELAFQIALTPSVAHVGSSPDIISEASLQGEDDFTGKLLKFFKPALNTYLSSDPNFENAWSHVVK